MEEGALRCRTVAGYAWVEVLEEGEALLEGGEVGREVEGGGEVVVKTRLKPSEEGG